MSLEDVPDIESKLRAVAALTRLSLPVSDPASMKRESIPMSSPATP